VIRSPAPRTGGSSSATASARSGSDTASLRGESLAARARRSSMHERGSVQPAPPLWEPSRRRIGPAGESRSSSGPASAVPSSRASARRTARRRHVAVSCGACVPWVSTTRPWLVRRTKCADPEHATVSRCRGAQRSLRSASCPRGERWQGCPPDRGSRILAFVRLGPLIDGAGWGRGERRS
jgi:hypothetical protein